MIHTPGQFLGAGGNNRSATIFNKLLALFYNQAEKSALVNFDLIVRLNIFTKLLYLHLLSVGD